ncbi:MAG: AAA family ATPase, partial [Candidatus Electryoneaceae bacterium]|nr:AAA family ATPase [Candidatus Electryoneaceae bacterium]
RMVQINTRNVLFICGGAFEGIDEIVQFRLGKHGMGFGSDVRGRRRMGYYDLISQVEPEDLLKYGLIPELIGRLPVTTPLDRLSSEAMKSVLTQPKNALIRQYQKLFEMERVKLIFEDAALDVMVGQAMHRDTGARALRSVIERFMMNLMFDLPDMNNVEEVIITPGVVRGNEEPKIFPEDAKIKRA